MKFRKLIEQEQSKAASDIQLDLSRPSNFEQDLSNGKAAEQLIYQVFKGKTRMEVKRDMQWVKTGNLFIETEAWSNKEQKWVISGASLEDFDTWSIVLSMEDSGFITLSRAALHRVIKARGRKIDNKMPPNPTKGVLIKPEDILDAFRGII